MRRIKEEIRMKKVIYYVLFITMFFIASCATHPVRQNMENLSFPELDTITTKSLGDILLSQGVKTTYPAIEMLHDSGRIVKGIYIGVGQEGNNIIYKPRPTDIHMNQAIGVFFLAGSNDNLNIAWRSAFGSLVKGSRIDNSYYNETTVAIESSNDFQQTLIYTGKEGNIIKATYREFSGNMARAAFTIDVTYDLNDSDIIAFRGARLQVIEATNTSITYKVISNFNQG